MDEELLKYLQGFTTERRNELFDRILEMRTKYLTLALEDIYQSNNASAVLRTCDCFGIQDVHVIENRNEYQLNTEVSLGAEKWLNIYKYNTKENNSIHALRMLREKGYRIIATTPHKNDALLQDFDIGKGKAAIFLGTELSGLSEVILENADEFIKIQSAMHQRLKELSGNSPFRLPDFLPEEMSRKIVDLGFELLDDAIVSLKEKITNKLFEHRN